MRRFDDVLRMFCSLVLGAVLRDAGSMARNFEVAVGEAPALKPLASLIGQATTIGLILLLLRAIHGSACFDLVGSRREGSQAQSSRAVGLSLPRRIWNQLLTVAALFFYPVAAAHFLARRNLLPASDVALFFLLFGSFLIYIIWDALLWADSVDGSLETASRNWTLVNGYILMAIVSVIVAHIVHVGGGVVPPRAILICGFVALAPLVVVMDYWINREFYFPEER